RLQDVLVALAAGDVALTRVEQVLAHARIDERALPVHVLLAGLEAPAGPARTPRLGAVRAVELRLDPPRNDDVDPADRVDQLLELAEVDEHDVVERNRVAGGVLDRLD